MLRISLLTAFVLACAALPSQPALAEDIGPKSKDYIEGKCNDGGGTFWATPDGASYGCGYKGGGGVICDKGGQDAQGNTVGPWCEETKREARGDSGTNWGLAGLLGLLGLAGLAIRPRRRDDRPTVAS